ncbi:unnamed protein product [Phytophthora fragariaefolia]|uniref:non-specific serine/threonine protein kinase n=1 Tax=Phytophthora fragariaefolia TaxID=1490495 RepID=A0A9W6U352_9STRA|nr:unnamed protein product [Phytophthora fragariaefolia]
MDFNLDISRKFYGCLFKKVTHFAHCSNVKIRDSCVKVLNALSLRSESGVFADEVFTLLLDLLLDSDGTLPDGVVPDALGGMARFTLMYQQKQSVPNHFSQALHSSFVGADFENIMNLFQSRDFDEKEWNRVCRQIMDRVNAATVAFGNSDVLLGAIRQAAAWCVQNRLRTHFGGPAQSFSSIEQLVQEHANDTLSAAEAAGHLFSEFPRQLTKWMLLEFVTALEMYITRAIYSTEIDSCNPDSEDYKTVLFFRTNKVVCDDWLNRIRPFLVEMSRNEASYELCRYHSHAMVMTCYNKLSRTMAALSRGFSVKIYSELMQAEKDMDVALFFLCRCHCDAKDVDTVIGFQRWGDSVSSALTSWYQTNKDKLGIDDEVCKVPLFRWLNAIRYEAEMRYEDAAIEYEALLQPILSVQSNSLSGGFNSTAEIFESPMTCFRMSSQALLGCFKQCAKCYSALREWAKLRRFATQFIHLAQSLVDYDRPIEAIQAIFDCSDMWSNEIETLHSLEAQVNMATEDLTGGSALKSYMEKRAASMLRIWNTLGDSDAKPPNPALNLGHVAGRIYNKLIPLALQPTPWNGYAGDKIGKKAEETLLRIHGISMTSSYKWGCKLNPEVCDSVIWSQPFCLTGDANTVCLYLTAVARLARKQHNFGFARKILTEAEALDGAGHVSSMAVSYEKARLLETIGMEDEGRRLLVTQSECNFATTISRPSCIGLESSALRALLYLAIAFTKTDDTELLSPATSRFLKCSVEKLCSQERIGESNENFLSEMQDIAANKCLEAAITISPKSSKAWIRYSHWCYDRGKREIAGITEQNGYIRLDPSDESQMNTLLDEIGIVEPDRDLVVRAFCQFLENGELTSQNPQELQQLCIDRAPPNYDRGALDQIVQLQQVCRSKVLHFFSSAARGYGKYLAVTFRDKDCKVPRQETTMVALRLLSLLTAYGAEEDVVSALEDVFSDGPVAPWAYIVPQLIARAHHPVAAVSSLVCLILKRLARHSPHAIVYPAVVDSMEPQVSFSTLQEERGGASNSFAAILQELQAVSIGQVEGVRLLISELRRISILWDEAWISTLMKLSTDVDRRTTTLEKEATRVDRNTSLSTKEKTELAQRKLVAIMKPILVSVERLWNETCGRVSDQNTVSPHERKFLKEYGSQIEQAMENFRDCCNTELRVVSASVTKSPQELWQPFAEILKALLNATGRRDQIPLHEISPSLATTSRQLALTNIPGAFSWKSARQTEPITIHRVDSSVSILRTKTKPKSLELIGSDGKTYKYLLKAREDLRLDERIMQFLRVTNGFLRADEAAASRDLSAQSYSVIPLSRNAGLIQMVPDVIPLFQVYTTRNEQQTNSGRAAQDAAAPTSSVQHQLPPPTAQFYAKLKQHGISNVSPNYRAQWPIPVLKQIYQELVAQRPRNVLQQEIVLRSEDVRVCWAKNVRLSKSVAVMSVLGYIVGLGDRHLDNILLCVNSGDVVHIDHNVCFDKGRRLKVPELVPFRLTPMLQDAFGLTGVEGRFRRAFETTLRVIRSDDVREALLALFEAFVYNPLVDWAADDKRQGRSGDLKARLEVNVNLSLFLSRAEERRQDTILFGRQYEHLADILSRVLTGDGLPFVTLLGKRKQIVALASEEQSLMKEALRVETELATCQATQLLQQAKTERAAVEIREAIDKLTAFANECWGRHQQIQAWRQKSVNFAETDPENQLHTLVMSAESASFQKIHARIFNVLERSGFVGRQTELLAALGTKCRAVDVDVARTRVEIQNLAGCLIPYLSDYSHWRKKLDTYLDTDQKMAGKDVYFMWWSRCSEYLRSLESGITVQSVCVDELPSTPSDKSIAESTSVLNRLNELRPESDIENLSIDSGLEHSYSLKVDNLLQGLSCSLTTMKLSNAQGQRLLKLAGASWIITKLDKLSCTSSFVSNECTSISAVLVNNPKFQFVAAVAHAAGKLLDLVSTPKGSMKRLRANELMAVDYQIHRDLNQDARKDGTMILNILQDIMSFAISFQEEFVLNIRGDQDGKNMEKSLLDIIQAKLTNEDGVQEVIDAVSSPETNDGSLDLKTLLLNNRATLNVFAASVVVIQRTASFVDILWRAAAMNDEAAEKIKISSRTSWIQLTLNLIRRFTEVQSDGVIETKPAEFLSAMLNDFLSEYLVELLVLQLSSIICHDWKFAFSAHACNNDTDGKEVAGLGSLSKRWEAFFNSQIPDMLPSALINVPSGTPEMQTGDVCNSVIELMDVCEEWCGHKWRVTQSQSWNRAIASLRKKHERRLQYATWLSTHPMTSELAELPSLTRIQLLTILSSQVPNLNTLLTQQTTIEANVLELAQQMDYFASSLDDGSSAQHLANDNLHASVQDCYAKVVDLFEYGRALADLVQGISVIETSAGVHIPEAKNVELEVDVVGERILLSAIKATSDLQDSSNALDETNAYMHALEADKKQKQTCCETLATRKHAVEAEFLGICEERKSTVMKTVRVLGKHVKEMRSLLRHFEKFKPQSKQNQVSALMRSGNSGRSEHFRSEQHDSTSLDSSYPLSTTGFCFMENDRLVKILLRSIRSVDHLQLLERVLEKHGETCTALREAVSRIDQIMRELDVKIEQLLTDSDHNPEGSSQAYMLLLLDLFEALCIKTEQQAGSPKFVATGYITAPLLDVARDLVRGCVKLFFEATEMTDRLSSAEEDIPRAFEVVSLHENGEENETEGEDDAASPALDSENSVGLPSSDDSASNVQDTITSISRNIEEKSQYGLQVLKRIEEKLSGHVTEMTQAPPVLTVEQQASWLIDEATKTDNLCVMYEGWTPWI